MKDALRKLLGAKPEEQLEQNDKPKEALTVAVDVMGLEQMNELSTQLAELAGTVEQLNSVVAEKDSLIATLNGKLESLSAFAAEAEAKAEALRVEAQEKAVAIRKEMLANVIGSANPGFNSTFEAIASLDDAAFETVVGGFAASFAKEAESVMFKEIGVSGEAEATSVENATMAVLRKTYPKK